MNDTNFLSEERIEERGEEPVSVVDEGRNTVLPNPIKKEKKKKRKRIPLFVFSALVVAFLVVNIIGIGRFATGMLEAQEVFESGVEHATAGDFVGAHMRVEEGIDALTQARSGLSFLVWTYPIPWVGDQVEAIARSLDAGKNAALALSDALKIARDVTGVISDAQELLQLTSVEEDVTFETLPQQVRSELLTTVHRSAPELQAARVNLRLASQDLDRLEELHVAPQITDIIKPFKEMIPTLISAVDLVIPFAATIDELAGVGQDKQWLLLFLNDMELRPGGGFIGVYGLATVRDGELLSMDIADSYVVDRLVAFDPTYQLAPPAPMQQYLNVDKWYFRDINWSPDFSVSASDARQVFRQQHGHAGLPVPQIDGVIGFTPTFASKIMQVTGPVVIDGTTYTHENLPELLEYEVEFGFVDRGVDYEERKDVVSELAEMVMHDLMHLPFSKYNELLAVFLEEIDSKHLLFYSTKEKTQQSFVDAGWAGKIRSEKVDDIVMFVDANLGALKTDRVMERSIDYKVVPSGDDYVATVTMTYDHQGSFDQFTTRYQTYARAYVPLGSELIRSSAPSSQVDVAEDLGFTSFGTMFVVEPGQTGQLSYTYKLPDSVADAIEKGLYQLAVFKQVGTKDSALTLGLDFGKNIQTASPEEERRNFGDTIYTQRANLNKDLLFTVQY